MNCGCGYEQGKIWGEVWKLPDSLSLGPLCSDFYLLYYLTLHGSAKQEFQEYLDQYTPIFARYTDMAVGGELRHAFPTQDESRRNIQVESMPPECQPLLDLLRSRFAGQRNEFRGKAWAKWFDFRQEHKTIALEWAVKVFYAFGNNRIIGGWRWADITNVLLQFEKGVLSPTLFIDSCWGLEHNGGCYFSKITSWNKTHLRMVLNANLAGNHAILLQLASPNVQHLYRKFQGAE